jgi:MG2 domain.
MKIAFVFNLMVALLRFSFINAQIDDQSILLPDFKKNGEVPFEKVYLHLDRPYYSAGEDIWIKAYLVNAVTNELSDSSNNLNVELLSPGSKIIKRLILRLDNGVGAGDFHLGDSIASGNYVIRAYTNWMRNFGDIFFFKQEIVVENQLEIKSIIQPDHQENNENVDVQFFPEGGPLIENVYTLLGFKAVNSSGYGCNVKGHVFSSPGDTVTSFSSSHLGMGGFFFLPKKGLKYYAAGYAGNGIPFKVELPAVSETGYSIKVSEINKDYFRVTIKTNQETLDKCPLNEMVIVGTSHNSLCITAKAKVRAIDNPVILSKKEFPEGVALITLMDTTAKKYCERAYYVHPKKNYQITIIPDHEAYAPRQKVTLQISVRDTSDNPVAANLSISVVDGNQIKSFEKKSDISSYLLLESEIRGYIEQPSFYFDTTISGRYQALDNLLITQGWRNFIWNNLPDTVNKFNYPIEEGITVSGRLW